MPSITDLPAKPTQRLIVPDVLRGVAIVAMLIAHAVPFLPLAPGALRFVMSNINDLASPLFALVMGMSAQATWNASVTVVTTFRQQLIRSVVLVALGVWMTTWGSWAAIVLAHLGVLLVVGVPLLLLRTSVLAVVAALMLAVSDPLNAWMRGQEWIFDQPAAIQEVFSWVFLGQSYRLTNLLPFFLLGALLLRHGFRRSPLVWAMLAIAPAAYLIRPVSEQLSGVTMQVSGSYADTFHDAGLVFAVYGVTVVVATVTRRPWSRMIDALFVPFRIWGRLALSLYVAHIGVIALWNSSQGYPAENAYLGWLLTVPFVLVLGLLWARYVGPGPLEWMLGLLSGRRKRFGSAVWPRSAVERSRSQDVRRLRY